MSLPEGLVAALDAPSIAHLATLMPDGAPHVSAVWIERSGENITVNTAEGRAKVRNIRRDPRIGISISPHDNPYANYTIRGRVVEITADGADAQIDRLAGKYLGVDSYPYRRPGEARRRVVIAVDHVAGYE